MARMTELYDNIKLWHACVKYKHT